MNYEEIYLKNEKLVYKFASQYKLLNNEDMMQNLKLAMYRAIIKYDPNKGFALSTYVYIALYHEYKYSFRDKNLKIEYVNNKVLDDNGKEKDIFDFIPDERNIDIDYELDKQMIFKEINEFLKEYDYKYSEMFYDYYFNHVNQKDLAKRYNLSQAQISRKLKSMIKLLQNRLKDFN